MSKTNPGPLPTSKMELAVTIIDGSLIYARSPVLARKHLYLSFITHINCYPVKSPALAIILHSLIYLLASKPGKICTRNSIDSFSLSLFSPLFTVILSLLVNFV